ncbi:hypothetical protein EJ110_NYTH47523 [Nymphaea thermarum]|nr:hypothetical protein EJ110_NYTH47523 [Nymphaea thermarum]
MVASDEQRKALLDQIIAGLEMLEETFEKCSKGGTFFGGARIGFLDIALGNLLDWLRVLESSAQVKLLHPSKTPKLVAWAESFCKDEAVKEVMPETDKLAEFAKTKD